MFKKKINIFILQIFICLTITESLIAQQGLDFLFTRGEDNVSIITTGSVRSTHCAVVEYPDFLILCEVTHIPVAKKEKKENARPAKEVNPLISFIDSIYEGKPIKYVFNSHHHSHSLSTIKPFFEVGAKLITAAENIPVYKERGLFDTEENTDYSESIIEISSDTVLFSETQYPVNVFHLKKSDYKSIPTKAFLFFYFPNKQLLAASCMVHLTDYKERYGLEGIVYNDRLIDARKIIDDKNIEVRKTLQLFRLRFEDDQWKAPIFPVSYMNDVLEHGWHRRDLADHFQKMSLEKLTNKKDSILSYLAANEIYYTVLNQAVYLSIERKEFEKAVALAQILILYAPDYLNEIDTIGEAYYNNGDMEMAKHYDRIIQRYQQKAEGLGFEEWEKNSKT